MAQSRFHVDERYAAIKGNQGSRHHRRCIPLGYYAVRPPPRHDGVDAFQATSRQASQSLTGRHEVQLIVRADAEMLQQRRQHVAMLAGRADNWIEQCALLVRTAK